MDEWMDGSVGWSLNWLVSLCGELVVEPRP
jgi:hypothetical protein